MTEKRFTKVEIRFNEFSIADNGSLMASYKVINTLNEQHEEIKELQKENKKLKEELEWCRMTVDGLKNGDVE